MNRVLALEGLLRLGEQLRTQHNDCTAEPMFLVERLVRDYGFDPQWSDDDIVWLSTDGDHDEADPEVATRLTEQYDLNCEPDQDGYTRTAYRERWEFRSAFLTRLAAETYIEQNRHRYREPLRVMTDSGYRNPEWIELRAALVALATLGVSVNE